MSDIIPKQIFQTWRSNDVNSDMRQAMQSWKKLNPAWTYHFFDDERQRQFIADNFPIEVVEAYDMLIPGAYKADLWRYCVLYEKGGVYADCKATLLTSLDNLLRDNASFYVTRENDQRNLAGYVYQAVIASTPKHPFLAVVIKLVVEHVQKGFYGKTSLDPTGPGALGQAINTVLGRKSRAQFGLGLQQIRQQRFCLWRLTDKNRQEGGHIVSTDSKPVFKTAYVGYHQDKLQGSLLKNYTTLWDEAKIYTDNRYLKAQLFPAINQMRAAYRQEKYKQAHCLLRQQIGIGNIHFMLLRYAVKHELIRAFKTVKKVIAIVLNKSE